MGPGGAGVGLRFVTTGIGGGTTFAAGVEGVGDGIGSTFVAATGSAVHKVGDITSY